MMLKAYNGTVIWTLTSINVGSFPAAGTLCLGVKCGMWLWEGNDCVPARGHPQRTRTP